MKLKVLGCDGGRGIGYNNTTFLFNDTVLIDAGTIQSKMTVDEALKVEHIFFTHTHLDHIADFPFFLDATFGRRHKPVQVYGLKEALTPMMEHIFNDKIWPNFSILPTKETGQFQLNYIDSGKSYEASGLSFTPVHANHTVPTVGYIVSDGNSSIAFSGDTGPNDDFWEVVNQVKNLKAVILDLSFSKNEQKIANLSKHMTAEDVNAELTKLNQECDVYVFHFKVGYSEILKEEISLLSHHGAPVKALRDFVEITF